MKNRNKDRHESTTEITKYIPNYRKQETKTARTQGKQKQQARHEPATEAITTK